MKFWLNTCNNAFHSENNLNILIKKIKTQYKLKTTVSFFVIIIINVDF